MAEGILTGVHKRTGLDVGEFPEGDRAAGTDDDDPERLVKIVSHMVARAFDRIGPLRKISRHMEGADKKSGFFSDALAAAIELYKRNPDRVQELATEYYDEFRQKRQAAIQEREAQKQAGNGRVPGEPQHAGV